jgi:hypothetical protein
MAPHVFRSVVMFAGALALAGSVACSRRNAHLSQAGAPVITDNSYTDLERGARLSVLLPLTKSGRTLPALSSQKGDGSTITLSAADLTGYETAYYAITGGRNGAVRLRFTSAEITRDGKTAVEPNPPVLPFALPQGREHIRLIYLVRASQADHNMAIVASKHLDALNTFTKQLKQDPRICARNDEVFCSWVPAGIAVRQDAASNE